MCFKSALAKATTQRVGCDLALRSVHVQVWQQRATS
eukprot:COSAG05_NODE_18852_length_301_cov_1.534653_1_plen_35_part_10